MASGGGPKVKSCSVQRLELYIYIIYTSFFAFSVDVLDFDLHPCSFLSKFLIELHTILVEELKSDLEAFLDILRSQKC